MQSCRSCFGSNCMGVCRVLTEKLLKDGYCPFYKTKEEYEEQLAKLDKNHEDL